MIVRLPYPDEKENPNPRADMLDGPLEVSTWLIPGQATEEELDRDTAPPAWWRGEEEASTTFFKAMGIDPTTLGGGG